MEGLASKNSLFIFIFILYLLFYVLVYITLCLQGTSRKKAKNSGLDLDVRQKL